MLFEVQAVSQLTSNPPIRQPPVPDAPWMSLHVGFAWQHSDVWHVSEAHVVSPGDDFKWFAPPEQPAKPTQVAPFVYGRKRRTDARKKKENNLIGVSLKHRQIWGRGKGGVASSLRVGLGGGPVTVTRARGRQIIILIFLIDSS
jgi:hypothetical protein